MGDLLTERTKQILRSVINEYILTAEPVSSRRVSKKCGLDLSPATVRNVMADLEEMGFLDQPHTSAGRVPTNKGFRFYVDYMLEIRGLPEQEKKAIEERYQLNLELQDLMRETSKILSSFSQHTAIVLAPRFASTIFKHIEFIKISKDRILVIFVSKSGIIQNKIIQMEEELTQDELDRFTRYLNEILVDLSLKEVREKIIGEMKEDKIKYGRLLSQALKFGEVAFTNDQEVEIYVEGKMNFFNYPEFWEVEKMRALFQTLEEKSLLLKLLDKTMEAKGVQIFIGAENPLQEICECTAITSSYTQGGSILGSLGVIGPTRMNYSEIIPIVDYTAKLISRILESQVS